MGVLAGAGVDCSATGVFGGIVGTASGVGVATGGVWVSKLEVVLGGTCAAIGVAGELGGTSVVEEVTGVVVCSPKLD